IELSDENIFKDTDVGPGKMYSYTVVSHDHSGNESSPANPVTVKASKLLFPEIITRFNATVNRDLRYISLSWNSKEKNVSEFILYKAEKGKGLSLYKTFDSTVKMFNDVNLQVNSEYEYAIRAVLKNGTQSQLKKVNVKY